MDTILASGYQGIQELRDLNPLISGFFKKIPEKIGY